MMGRPRSFLPIWPSVRGSRHISSHRKPQVKRQTQRQIEGKGDAQRHGQVDTRLSRIVHALASACGGIVLDDYEGTSLDSVRLMAASGAGIAILPELYAREQAAIRKDVALRLLHAEGASREIALLQPAGQDEDGLDLIRTVLLDAVAALGLADLAMSTGSD